jgi:hypothetical protein
MALVGLSEAARITGRNRTTIFRAMKSGRLSFTTNGAGERQVDVAELERVFAATDAEQPKSDATHVAVLGAQLDAERRQNALLERTCEDLRRRLDEADAERRNRLGRSRVGRIDGRDDDASRPDLRRPSLPRRDHQLRCILVPVEPAHGRGDAGRPRHLCNPRDDPAMGSQIRAGIRRGDKWRLDEVVISIAGKKHWL